MQPINDFLFSLAKKLDITDIQYKAVVERYTDVAIHLAQQKSVLFPYKPDIKPQGSFLLGTMIQSIEEGTELDVDLVCRLHGKKVNWTQRDIKDAVGHQLKLYDSDECKLDREGNRCWTLTYRNDIGFHMDILPAVVGLNHFTILDKSFRSADDIQAEQIGLRITDKRRSDYSSQTEPQHWPESNPFGYAAWFKGCANTASSKSFSWRDVIEPLPGYEAQKEPLIRVIQVLKRHRDVMFGGDLCKPASIIITTLAARSYKKETELMLALNNILMDMEAFIEERFSIDQQRIIKWIANPVNDKENFADSWLYGEDGRRKESQFYRWLKKARIDFDQLSRTNLQDAYAYSTIILRADVLKTKTFLPDK